LAPAITSCDVYELIKDVIDILSSQAELRKIKILQQSTSLKGKNLMIDPQRVTQILINLISNATKFSQIGGKIRVGAICTKGALKIRVVDYGIGISPES
jgi:signal transduction histidine kinase